MRKKIKNVLSIFQNMLIIFLLLLILFILYDKFLCHKERISIFGCSFFIIVSGSMEPNLNIYDIAITSSSHTNQIKQGDIIAFHSSDRVILHRVYSIENNNGVIQYKTKGDNNNTVDFDLVNQSDIIGKYKIKIPYVGKLLLYIRNNPIIGFAILLLLLLIFILFKNLNKLIQKKDFSIKKQ